MTGSLNTMRGNHTATLLPNGQVLVAGGWNGDISNIGLASAEIYDPGTGTWTTTNAMNTARQNHTATLLPNGQVLIAGGASNTGATNSAELFNPTNGTWTAIASMTTNRRVYSSRVGSPVLPCDTRVAMMSIASLMGSCRLNGCDDCRFVPNTSWLFTEPVMATCPATMVFPTATVPLWQLKHRLLSEPSTGCPPFW